MNIVSAFKANAALCCPLSTVFLLLTDVDRKSNARNTTNCFDITEAVKSDTDVPK